MSTFEHMNSGGDLGDQPYNEGAPDPYEVDDEFGNPSAQSQLSLEMQGDVDGVRDEIAHTPPDYHVATSDEEPARSVPVPGREPAPAFIDTVIAADDEQLRRMAAEANRTAPPDTNAASADAPDDQTGTGGSDSTTERGDAEGGPKLGGTAISGGSAVETKSDDELIIDNGGTGYDSPSNYVQGTGGYEPL